MTCERLSALIENDRLYSYFQPIVDLRSNRIIGAICWRGDIPMTCYDIAHMASEAKAMAKKENGNALFVERRERLTQGFAEETERECRVA